MKVCKFGGSSLADASQIKKVIQIIMSDPDRQIIIVSAPGKRDPDDKKITDHLYEYHAIKPSQEPFLDDCPLRGPIRNRYIDIIHAFGIDFDLNAEVDEIRRVVQLGASCDYVVSRGEYLMGKIFAKIIGYEFVDPIDFIPLDSKRNFCGSYEDIKSFIAGRKVVIPGFYGYTANDQPYHFSSCSNTHNEIRTFERGGSDITGAIIACAVNASVYENWTDVSGMLMADPKIVSGACSIETLTYRELRELSYMGASVFHEVAMFPVWQAGIKTNILNTNDPDHPGTLVVTDNDTRLYNTVDITGVAGRKDFVIINIEKMLMNQQVGFVRKILTVLEEHDISFEHIPGGIDTMSIVVHASQFTKSKSPIQTIVKEISDVSHPDKIVVTPGIALIVVVGTRMVEKPGVAARIMTALALQDINIRMIDQGSSEISVIVGVNNDDYKVAVRAIYEAFVLNGFRTYIDKLKKLFCIRL